MSLPAAKNPAVRQLLVAFEKLPSVADRDAIWKKFELREIEQLTSQPLFLVEAPAGTDGPKLKKIQEALGKETGIRYAEPNLQMRTFRSGS